MSYEDGPETRGLFNFRGSIKRSTSRRFQRRDQIAIRPLGINPDGESFLVEQKDTAGGDKGILEPIKRITLDALLVPAEGKERTELLFAHPADSRRVVGIVLDDTDPGELDDRGEVDGVWIAEEGGGIDDPPA